MRTHSLGLGLPEEGRTLMRFLLCWTFDYPYITPDPAEKVPPNCASSEIEQI
jgi:hypothetical protein